jgi:hypothetical protein
LDEVVDDEALHWVIERRYTLDDSRRANGRRFLIYH